MAKAVQQLDQQGPVAAGGGVLEGAYRLVLIGPPAGGHRVQLGRPPRAPALQVGEQMRAQQLLNLVGLARPARRRDQGGLPLEPIEDTAGLLPFRQRGGEPDRHQVTDADHAQELLRGLRQPGQDLPNQIVGHRAVVSGEVGEERLAVGGLLHGAGGQPQTGDPAAGPPVQHLDLLRGQS